VSTLRSTATFLDSSILVNLIFETEMTEKTKELFSKATNPVISETVIDECVYVVIRKTARDKGIKSLHDLRKFLKTPEGKEVLKSSIERVLAFVGEHEIEVVGDPSIFVSLSIAEKYGLLMHDAKILGAMVENGIKNIATLDRDFEGIPIVEVLKPD